MRIIHVLLLSNKNYIINKQTSIYKKYNIILNQIQMQDKDVEMKQEHVELMKEKLFTNSLFETESYKDIFHIIAVDQQAQTVFSKNLKNLLSSKHAQVEKVFQFCLQQKDQIYTECITEFLRQYLFGKIPLFLSDSLQQYLISNIWKQDFCSYRNILKIGIEDIISFLSLKMRSLEIKIRYCALTSLTYLIEGITTSGNADTLRKAKTIIPQMIQKQTLSKNMSFTRGILLQILQDETCEIKIKGVQLLGLSSQFFNIRMLRLLILYMLNDEHQLVRQTSLRVLSLINSFDLQKQDLKALLMCLKQNNIKLRGYVYQNLVNINVTSPEDFMLVLQKLFQTLILYKIDKKPIYKTCKDLGEKYPGFVLDNLGTIYHYSQIEEPNWKNLMYKARVITLASVGKDKWPLNLPRYFKNHYLYIRDIQFAAFSQDTQINLQRKNTLKLQNIYINNSLQLQHLINAYILANKGFTQSAMSIFQKMLSSAHSPKFWSQLEAQIKKLHISYNIQKNKQATNFMKQIQMCYYDYFVEQRLKTQRVKNLVLFLADRSEQFSGVPEFLFKVSTHDRSCILISNNQRIIKQSYLLFIVGRQQTASQRCYYIKMSEVQFQVSNDEFLVYRIEFKWKSIQCFVVYQQRSTNAEIKYLRNITDSVSAVQ